MLEQIFWLLGILLVATTCGVVMGRVFSNLLLISLGGLVLAFTVSKFLPSTFAATSLVVSLVGIGPPYAMGIFLGSVTRKRP